MEEGSGEKSTLWGLPSWMVVVGGLLVLVILYVLYRDYEASKTTSATDISTAAGTTTSTGTGTGTTTINPVVYEVGSGAAVAGQTTSSTTNTPVGSNSPTNTPSTPTGTLTPEPPSATVTSPTGLITEGEPVSTPIANPVETTTGTPEPSTEVSNAASSQKVVKTSTEAANQITSGVHNALSSVAAAQTQSQQSQMSADIMSANATHPVLSSVTTSTLQAEGILPSSSASNFYSSEQNYVGAIQAIESHMSPSAKKMQAEATNASLASEQMAKIDAALGETPVRG